MSWQSDVMQTQISRSLTLMCVCMRLRLFAKCERRKISNRRKSVKIKNKKQHLHDHNIFWHGGLVMCLKIKHKISWQKSHDRIMQQKPCSRGVSYYQVIILSNRWHSLKFYRERPTHITSCGHTRLGWPDGSYGARWRTAPNDQQESSQRPVGLQTNQTVPFTGFQTAPARKTVELKLETNYLYIIQITYLLSNHNPVKAVCVSRIRSPPAQQLLRCQSLSAVPRKGEKKQKTIYFCYSWNENTLAKL